MLHATKIEFIHPSLNKLMSFTKNPPKEFLEVLQSWVRRIKKRLTAPLLVDDIIFARF